MYSAHGMFSNKMAGNNERVSRESFSLKSKETQICHKIVRGKFPGKPTKCSTRSRVNLRTQVRPEETENSLAAEDICRGLLSALLPENQDSTRTRLQASRAAEELKERLHTSPHTTVFDGGGRKRKRGEGGAAPVGRPSKVAKKLTSRTCVVAQRLVKRAKGGITAPKKEQKTPKGGNFTLPARSAHSRRTIKPNRKFLTEEEAAPPRVILREARLQVGVPAPSPPARGPFSSPTCGVCGGLREGTPPAPGVKPPIRSCSTCYRKAKFLAKRPKTLICQGRQGSTCAMTTDCDRCWLQRALSFFAITTLLRGKLANLLPDPAALSTYASVAEMKPKPEPAKESPAKKPVPEIRQRLERGGPRVKNVCRSASVALGQPAALFPSMSPPPPPPAPAPVANGTLAVGSAQPTSTKAKPVPAVAALPDAVLLPVSTPAPQILPEPDPIVVPEDVPNPAPVSAAGVEEMSAVVPAPLSVQVKPKRKKSQTEEKEELISMDFWENYDPEEVCDTGFSLIGSVPFCATPLCFLCGSAGRNQMVVCGCCCEPYHTFCVGVAEDTSGWDWVCPRCRVCAACGLASGQQLCCVRCENSYHTACAGGRLHHAPDRPWVCWLCLRCKSCNGEDVSVFVGNLPLCKTCFVLRQRGNFCPLCQRCYDDDDYDCKMMECGGCGSWVHAKCEGLSDEKYQVLSFLPESIEFICRICCVLPPAPWWLAVEAELKAGYLGVLKALSKSKTACRVLKWSPRKLTDCSCRRATKSTDSEESIQSDGGCWEGESSAECLCFLEDDRYTSRSKPFSADLISVKQKVMDCEYSSLTHFHNDMTAMMESAHVSDLLDCYHAALKEVFPWFEPRAGKVLEASRSVDNTPNKSTPMKVVPASDAAPCLVPSGVTRPEYVSDASAAMAAADERGCVLCKGVGDAAPGGPGRLLYCGNNEWIHVNCALWSNDVYEEIDGSLQRVHFTLARARQAKCSHCGLRGASVNCCLKTCSEYYHFSCAQATGATFLQNNRLFCPAHAADADARPLEGERRFEVRRAVYVELDNRRSKSVPVSQVRLAVGSLRVQALGRFVPRLSDLKETIMPADFLCHRWFFSTIRPWQVVSYTIHVRLQEPEQSTGLDLGINLTVDHARPEAEPTLRTVAHFLTHLALPPGFVLPPPGTGPHRGRRKRRLPEPMEEADNQDLLPPELEEAIFKELSHDILDGISVQDIFQDMSEQEREGEEEETGRRRGVAATLRSGNRNVSSQVTKWKKKPQEGKENKLVPWCVKLLQVDGGVDSSSSSGSEAGESPARCADTPVIPQLDGIDESDSEEGAMGHDFMDFRESKAALPVRRWERESNRRVPQLDGTEDSDYETEAEQEGEGAEGGCEESPVECSKCKCTYRTQRSYEKHLETRCHELLSSSDSDSDTDDSVIPVLTKIKQKTVLETTGASSNAVSMMMQSTMMSAPSQQFQPMVQYVMPAAMPTAVPAAYQLVLPPSPMIIAPSPQPVYGVVADPQTGGMFLAPAQQATAPPPLLYNMETIVSNTVQQSIHQYVHTSYSHTQSTQLLHTTKQVMSMPTGYVLAPNDLICVPVTPPRVNLAPAAPAAVAPIQWTPTPVKLAKPIAAAPALQWTPATPKPTSRPQGTALQFHKPQQYTAVGQKPAPKPRPAKAKPSPQRSGGLVDFINNFTIEDGPAEATPNRKAEKSPRSSHPVQQLVSQAPIVVSVAPQTSSNKSLLTPHTLTLNNQPVYTLSTSQSMRPSYTISTQHAAIQPTFTLSTQNSNQPTFTLSTHSGTLQPTYNSVQPTYTLAPNGSLQQAYTLSTQNGSLPTTFTISPQNRTAQPTFTLSPQGGQPTLAYATQNNSYKVSPNGLLQPTLQKSVESTVVYRNQNGVSSQQKRVQIDSTSSQPNYTFTVVSQASAGVSSSAGSDPIYTLSVVPQPRKNQPDSSPKQQQKKALVAPVTNTPNSAPVQSTYTVTIVSEPSSVATAGQSDMLFTDSLTSSNSVSAPDQQNYATSLGGRVGMTQYNKPVVVVPPAGRNPQTAVVRPVMSMPCLEVACEEPSLSMPMLVSPPSPASCSPFSPQPQISRSANLRTYSHADQKQNVASSAPTKHDEKPAASTVHFPSSLVLPSSQAVTTLLNVQCPESPKLCSTGPLVPEFLSSKSCHVVSMSSPVHSPQVSPKSPRNISSANPYSAAYSPRKLSPLATHNPTPSAFSEAACFSSSPQLPTSDSFFFQPPASPNSYQPPTSHSLNFCNPSVNTTPPTSVPIFTSTQESFSVAGPTLSASSPSQSSLSNIAVNTPMPAEITPKKETDSSPKKVMSPLSLAPPRLPNRPPPPATAAPPPPPRQKPQLMFDVVATDGSSFSSTSLADVWNQICESVQSARAAHNMPQPHMAPRSFEIVGVGNHGLQHLLEQLPGAGLCHNYRPRYFHKTPSLVEEELLSPPEECQTGCARTEGFSRRKDPDRFGWLASRHRKLPKATVERIDSDAAVNRRSTNLPMAMRYRLLREAPSNELFVYRSKIHGMGLFCTREIDPGEMVIEYAGELIRASLTDKREKLYTERGIGCYMFRIDDLVVVDATVRGNPARFINHSCEPNCYSKVVDILGRKHIIIFALRRIPALEELTYDYKFPFEDVKISCHCQSRKCRKYLN